MPTKVALLILLFVVGLLIYNNFTYTDEVNNCKISIVPSVFVPNWSTKETIKVLRYGDPDAYKLLCSNVHKIVIDSNCGGFDGGCYYHGNKGTVVIGPDTRDVALVASIIGHENCHVMQEKENRAFSEDECYKVMRVIYKKLMNV